jgi:hypothetical protein
MIGTKPDRCQTPLSLTIERRELPPIPNIGASVVDMIDHSEELPTHFVCRRSAPA